ncbi:MAG: RNA polymerase sigma-70 factor [Flavobacteriaceae bacterium]|nr:RNA polymerase sigma-70 factor [Flavobacteriaceae bacterium]MCY4267636.1 RNA polymerase sigma-70 factor [Flavobacteriaceae bacterium]
MKKPEKSLSKQLRSGSVKAYDTLVDLYYQKLCAYSYSLCHDYSKTEDIVQNVLLRLWINRNKINPELSLINFLYKSVYNEFIDQYRKEKLLTYLEKKHFERLQLIMENEPDELDSQTRQLKSAIDRLPPKCKKVFLLNKREGLTHIEIAEYLNISKRTVDWHMTNAFKILRKKL